MSHVNRQTTAEKNIDAWLGRSFGSSKGVFRASLQHRDQLVLVGFVYIKLEAMEVTHDKASLLLLDDNGALIQCGLARIASPDGGGRDAGADAFCAKRLYTNKREAAFACNIRQN